MPFIQNTDADRAAMLAAVGVKTLEDLFEGIPAELRHKGPLPIDAGLSEDELWSELQELASWNSTTTAGCFLGAGMYRHWWPRVVDALQGRQEFVTAYTPYQPEASQGTLTAFFEFQTMVAALTGMEVANASMYDGSSAAAEAVVMAANLTRGRDKVVVSRGVHPHTRRTITTYLEWTGLEVVEAPLGADGRTELGGLLDDKTCALVVQSPNTLGVIEDGAAQAAAAKQAGAISVACVYPIALGLLESPGAQGFDVAVGDGQSLGVPTAFGGPSFGLFATRLANVRRMPGRIVGQTVDGQGRRGFALTFQTREQHIRRAKATSNICTNNALIALRGAIYMAAAGPAGLREVAEHCLAKTQYAARELEALPGFSLRYGAGASFNEFVLDCPVPAAQVNRAVDAAGMIGGFEIGRWYPELGPNALLLAFTELTTRREIDALVRTLAPLAAAATVA
ncbi:MAG: aminomethyl-transferring glycine dehydrogenase subunit GcvPA [Planctomycetes bacterium]|nr:aminomethyl-transferring glycine dehydrogenase subunit GcvPA [Planctomycetota bacterium]